MKELKKVLFCTDFSPNARVAFEYALEVVSHRPGAELILLHVIPAPDAQYWKPYIYTLENDADSKAKETFDRRVAEEYEKFLPKETKFRAVFKIGKAYAEISKFAQEENVELIVMGRQGHGALESLFFGSVAEKVVGKVNCPVLVIPPQA